MFAKSFICAGLHRNYSEDAVESDEVLKMQQQQQQMSRSPGQGKALPSRPPRKGSLSRTGGQVNGFEEGCEFLKVL